MALLLALTASFAYVAVEREIYISQQRLRHHLEHVEMDYQALQTAMGQLSASGDQDYFREARRHLLVTPAAGQSSLPDTERYSVYDSVFHTRLELELPTTLRADRLDAAALGVSISQQLYSSLSQMPSSSLFPLIVMSRDGQVSISTPCEDESPRASSNAVTSCQNRQAILDGTAAHLKSATEALRLTAVKLGAGQTAVLAYRLIRPTARSALAASMNREWVAVSYFDTAESLSRSYAGMRGLMGATSTSTVELFDNEGRPISPEPLLTEQARPGWNMAGAGLIYRIDGRAGISARYFTPYGDYIRSFGPELLGVGLLIFVCSMVTLLIAKWYVQRFYEPAQRQLKRIEESDIFGRQVIDASQLAIVVCGRSDGRILRANELASEWFDDAERMRETVAQWTAALHWGEASSLEQRLTLGPRHLIGKFLLTRYENQDALLCTFRDVSEDQQAKETLELARQAADESNAAKSEFLATMSHEIRTPLYGVLGMLELLASTPLSSVQHGFIRTIQSSSDQLMNVIGDVLDMSKIEAGGLTLHSEPFSPIELTESVLQVFGAKAAAKGIFLHSTIDTAVPMTLTGDAGRLRQILSNLISNAIKFTEIGRVTVALTVELVQAGPPRLQWRVSDTGVGMSESELVHVFEPFYQARSARLNSGGTGLGLAICHKLATMMNGRIQALSQRNVGSTFLLDVPLAQPAAPAQDHESTDDALRGVKVYLRAPTQELRDHYRSWLTKWGADCELLGGQSTPMEAQAVLVQVLPEQMSPIPGHARQVFCTQIGPLQPNPVQQGWQISCLAVRSLLLAVQFAAERQPASTALPEPRGSVATQQALGRLGLRVLVVEDSALNQEVLRWQLESLGCEVTLCGSPLRALTIWSDDVYDILLTDANMPEMSGRDMVRQLREQGMKRPVVCVTANAMSEIEPDVSEGLIDAWLIKPVSSDSLKVCLVKVCSSAGRDEPAIRLESELLDQSDGEDVPDFIRDVFVTSMSSDLELLRRALDDGEFQAMGPVLHRVRGGLTMAGVKRLASECSMLEALLASEDAPPTFISGLGRFCDALEDKIQAVKQVIAASHSQ